MWVSVSGLSLWTSSWMNSSECSACVWWWLCSWHLWCHCCQKQYSDKFCCFILWIYCHVINNTELKKIFSVVSFLMYCLVCCASTDQLHVSKHCGCARSPVAENPERQGRLLNHSDIILWEFSFKLVRLSQQTGWLNVSLPDMKCALQRLTFNVSSKGTASPSNSNLGFCRRSPI